MSRIRGSTAAPAGHGAGAPRRAPSVLLLGNYVPSLAAARALAAAGYRVLAGDGGEYSTVARSRYCHEVWPHPPISEENAFLRALVALLAARHEIVVVLPLQERYVAVLARARARLPAGVVVAAPDEGVVEACLDKVRMHHLAMECGVATLPLVTALDHASLLEAVAVVGYPCVVRPGALGAPLPGGDKALVCHDRAELDRLLERMPILPGPLLLQRYVAGPRHNVYLIAAVGRILARMETRVARTDRRDGTGFAVEEVVVPLDERLTRSCDDLIARLGYTGVGSAQFILPAEGDPHFLEINPRHDASSAGPEAFGLPLTLAAIGLASGMRAWPGNRASHDPAVGGRLAWTSRDLYGLGVAITRREIGLREAFSWFAGALAAGVRADVHLTWSWRDPLPTIAVYAHLASLGPWRRSRRRRRRRAEFGQADGRGRGGSSAPRSCLVTHEPAQRTVTGRTVLILGGRHPALAALRALAAAGYRVVVGDGGEYSTVRHSRYCTEIWRHPAPRDGEAFLGALADYLARRREITAVLPLHDRYVALLAANRDRLPASVSLAAADSRVVETCLDKARMYALAAEAGVPHAMIREAAGRAELAAAADEVGYPCVVRPAVFGGPMPDQRKAMVCTDRDAIDVLVAEWPDPVGSMLVQRHVEGRRHNLWFAAREGEVLATLQAVTLRTDRSDGTGILVEGLTVAPDARLRGYLETLVARLDYTGVGGAQFIVPDHGEPSFLEINPRPAGTGLPILRHCRLDLAVAAVQLASNDADWRPDATYRHPVGRRYAWTSRDLYGLGMAISRREVSARGTARWLAGAALAAARADVHLVWDRHDPLPALAVLAHLATLGPWRLARRRG
jgi:biotin carboxylase